MKRIQIPGRRSHQEDGEVPNSPGSYGSSPGSAGLNPPSPGNWSPRLGSSPARASPLLSSSPTTKHFSPSSPKGEKHKSSLGLCIRFKDLKLSSSKNENGLTSIDFNDADDSDEYVLTKSLENSVDSGTGSDALTDSPTLDDENQLPLRDLSISADEITDAQAASNKTSLKPGEAYQRQGSDDSLKPGEAYQRQGSDDSLKPAEVYQRQGSDDSLKPAEVYQRQSSDDSSASDLSRQEDPPVSTKSEDHLCISASTIEEKISLAVQKQVEEETRTWSFYNRLIGFKIFSPLTKRRKKKQLKASQLSKSEMPLDGHGNTQLAKESEKVDTTDGQGLSRTSTDDEKARPEPNKASSNNTADDKAPKSVHWEAGITEDLPQANPRDILAQGAFGSSPDSDEKGLKHSMATCFDFRTRATSFDLHNIGAARRAKMSLLAKLFKNKSDDRTDVSTNKESPESPKERTLFRSKSDSNVKSSIRKSPSSSPSDSPKGSPRQSPGAQPRRRFVRVVRNSEASGEEYVNPHVVRRYNAGYWEKANMRKAASLDNDQDKPLPYTVTGHTILKKGHSIDSDYCTVTKHTKFKDEVEVVEYDIKGKCVAIMDESNVIHSRLHDDECIECGAELAAEMIEAQYVLCDICSSKRGGHRRAGSLEPIDEKYPKGSLTDSNKENEILDSSESDVVMKDTCDKSSKDSDVAMAESVDGAHKTPVEDKENCVPCPPESSSEEKRPLAQSQSSLEEETSAPKKRSKLERTDEKTVGESSESKSP